MSPECYNILCLSPQSSDLLALIFYGGVLSYLGWLFID
jgi:hypothetical protein